MLLTLLAACSAAAPLAWVKVPSDRPADALPLVIAVHGLGDRPESLAALVGSCDLPVRIVAPRAPEPHGDGWSWFGIDRTTSPPTPEADGIARSADRLAELIATVKSSRTVVGEPVITGFSQGGMLSFAVATRHPDAVGTAIPIAGVLPEPLLPSAPPPEGGPVVRALHGLSDPLVPADAARRTVAALQAQRWDVSLAEFEDTAHQVTPPVRRAMCEELTRAIAR